MRKCERLTKNKEFKNVYKAGRRWSGPFFTMYIKKNGSNCTRLGVSVSKRVGNSVVRNRVKRRIKEIFRINMGKIKKGFDIVVSTKPAISTAEFKDIEKELKRLLKRGHLI